MRISTALGGDVLLLAGFAGEEGVSMPFHFSLDLLSDNAQINASQLLNTPAAVTLTLPDGGERIIHGRISRFAQLEREGEFAVYRAELVPWLWFLSLSSDCRIFQNLSPLDIIEKVFKGLGFSDFEVQCKGTYAVREYCVQYRETDLNFVSRLLEEEGIFYFFKHSAGKHVLVLADTPGTFAPCPSQGTARMAATAGAWQGEDVITSFEQEQSVHTEKVTLEDYDFTQPSLDLLTSVTGKGSGERYDYPGRFTTHAQGDRYARLRLEEQETWAAVVRGTSTCRAFTSGTRFDLKEHFRSDANQTYALIRVQHAGEAPGYQSRSTGGQEYQNSFVAIPASGTYRPPRTAVKPAAGAQTALVVGPSGEEIYVDKYGRVKVQFHWDRLGKKDENSSCWVRVSSAWAGKNWGMIQLPRIGQEVVVDFLEGDPDQPIITGRVYNAVQMPPYTLPDNQTQSGVKSRSSKGGDSSDFNEIRFEDKTSSEEVYVHAQKDLNAAVVHDETLSVGNDRTTTIKHDDKRTVTNDDSLTIQQGKQTILLQTGNQETTLQAGNQTVTLDQGDQSITLTAGNHKMTLGDGNYTLALTAGDQKISLEQGKQTVELTSGDQQITLSEGNRTVELKMGNLTTTLDLGNATTKASVGKISFEAMQGIELKVGDNSITIDPTGVTIKGMMVSVQGEVQTELKGVMTSVGGDGMLTLKGGITMIN